MASGVKLGSSFFSKSKKLQSRSLMTTVSDATIAHFLKQKPMLFFFDSFTIRFRVLFLAAVVSDIYDSIGL